jgi:hypothetical protein
MHRQLIRRTLLWLLLLELDSATGPTLQRFFFVATRVLLSRSLGRATSYGGSRSDRLGGWSPLGLCRFPRSSVLPSPLRLRAACWWWRSVVIVPNWPFKERTTSAMSDTTTTYVEQAEHEQSTYH